MGKWWVPAIRHAHNPRLQIPNTFLDLKTRSQVHPTLVRDQLGANTGKGGRYGAQRGGDTRARKPEKGMAAGSRPA